MFVNRNEAGLLLAQELQKYKSSNGVVLAIPRGGVPVGNAIASVLGLPLEIILSKKIGHPHNPEFAIGSVTPEEIIINETTGNVSESYIQEEAERIRKELQHRYTLFAGNRKPVDLQGKTVIITDDGIATGHTLMACIKSVRKKNPARIVVAVPVAPPETADVFRRTTDEFICLLEPADFLGVGQFYEDFAQVSDEEVKLLLDKAAQANIHNRNQSF